MGFKKKLAPQPAAHNHDADSGWRSLVLSRKASEIGISPSKHLPVVWGVLMEFVLPHTVVSLVSLADNTTSLCFSIGGGVIDAGEHADVAQATHSYLELAHHFQSHFQATAEFPPPAAGRVHFYLLTFAGVVTADADELELRQERHALAPLFFKGHEVITHVRMNTE